MLTEQANTPGIKPLPKEEPTQNYVPSEFRGIVDTILNKKFAVSVEAAVDTPTFMLTITVPEEYSRLSEDAKQMLGGDRRPKVISNAEGSQGVRAWAERVFSSFSPDLQAKITADRMTAM